MADIEIPAESFLDFIFIEIVGTEIVISCNHCMIDDVEFYKGDPNFVANKNWLVDMATHLRTVHPSSLRK
jgi:hypothetical protein